jgi:uncharacterized protein
VNAPLRPSFLLRPFLTLVAACFGLLLLPALASVGATSSPLLPRVVVPAEARLCGGRACTELVEMEVRDVVPLESASHAVVLVTKDRETVLPIFVDEGAAVAIAFRLAHRTAPHPQAQDLTDSMMTQLGGELTEVRIDRVDDAVFTGKVLVTQGARRLQLPARPSDSIALALAHGVKIFASRQVLSNAGISQADIEHLKKKLPRHHQDRDLGRGGSGEGGKEPEAEAEEEAPRGKGETIRL